MGKDFFELLAPAGGMEHLRAAVQAGADAVYLGGRLFNARIKASNFDDEEMEAAVDYAHLRGVKVFVTMNTLLSDEELAPALEYAGFLYRAGVDALIVQDLGLAHLIRRDLPDFPLHFSTQGTIFNRAGVQAAAALGFERVVLARELSLEDIGECTGRRPSSEAAAKPGSASGAAAGLQDAASGRRPSSEAAAKPGSASRAAAGLQDAASGAAAERTEAAAAGEIREDAEDFAAWPEIEVFVHGALCVCYSGQCHMSRLSGGRSGNRGLCAQPCRLSYEMTGGTGRGKNGLQGYFLSPKDLCALPHLAELMNLGVKSFKIEGRIKSPEYVGVVVGIYRKYMDMILENGPQGPKQQYEMPEIAWEDMEALRQIFSRGSFTDGYLTSCHDGMISPDIQKHQGLYIGKVLGSAGRDLYEIELDRGARLEMGDGVEIHSKIFTGNVVTYLKHAPGDKTGRRLIIGDIKGAAAKGDRVYKITEKSQLEKARHLYTLNKEGRGPNIRRRAVDIYLDLEAGKPALMRLQTAGPDSAKCGGTEISTEISFADIIPEKPQNRSMEKERIEQQLSKMGDFPFEAGDLRVNIKGDIAVPVSALNRIRREGLERLANEIVRSFKKNGIALHDKTTVKKAEKDGNSYSYNNYKEENDNGRTWSKNIIGICDSIGSGADICSKPSLTSGEECSLVYLYDINAFGDIKQAIRDEKCLELTDGTWSAKNRPEGVHGGKEAETGKLLLVPVEQADDFLQQLGTESADALPEDFSGFAFYISRVSYGRLDAWLDANFERLAGLAEMSGHPIFAGNLSWLWRLSRAGIPVAADYGMNAVNDAAAQVMNELGASYTVEALEFREDARGLQPMMLTEQLIGETGNRIQSQQRKKAGKPAAILLRSPLGDKTYVLGR